MTKEEAAVLQPVPGETWSDWSAQYSDLHDSCCQVHTIDGEICSAVVSVTNDTTSKICSTARQPDQPEHLKAITKFCAFQLAKILADNQFSWDNITMLRFYYSVEHPVAADTMSHAFSEALHGACRSQQFLKN